MPVDDRPQPFDILAACEQIAGAEWRRVTYAESERLAYEWTQARRHYRARALRDRMVPIIGWGCALILCGAAFYCIVLVLQLLLQG